jgi:hypothetical protein
MRPIRCFSLRSSLPVFMFIVCLGTSVFCQKPGSAKMQGGMDIPPPVAASFQEIFPNAMVQGVNTTMKNGAACVRIEMVDGAERRSAVFSSAGVIIEVVDRITIAALPERVQKAVSRNYPLANIVEAYKKTANDGYEYSVKVAAKKDTTQLNFTSTAMTISSKGSSEKSRAEKNTGLAQH